MMAGLILSAEAAARDTGRATLLGFERRREREKKRTEIETDRINTHREMERAAQPNSSLFRGGVGEGGVWRCEYG